MQRHAEHCDAFRQIKKKVKTYHDGFLSVSNTRRAKLISANGTQILSSVTLPRSLQLAADVDGAFWRD